MNAVLNNKIFTAPMLWTAGEVDAVTNGASTSAWVASGVVCDASVVKPGDLYIHLDNSLSVTESEALMIEAFRKGASAILTETASAHLIGKIPFTLVKDSFRALLDMASVARLRGQGLQSIAIAGTVGKSSIRALLNMGLSRQGIIHSHQTPGVSTHLSLPLSLANTHPKTQFGLYEVDVRRHGEAYAFSRQCRPTVAILSQVNVPDHDHFESLDELTEELTNIFAAMESDGTVVLDADCPYYPDFVAAARMRGIRRVWSYGGSRHAHARLIDIQHTRNMRGDKIQKVTMEILGERIVLPLLLQGRHMVDNVMAALLGVLAIGGDIEQAVRHISQIRYIPGRGRIQEFTINHPTNPVKIIDETLHFCPVSVETAIETLGAEPTGPNGRKVMIIGDLPDLPDSALGDFYEEIEYHADYAGIHEIYGIGNIPKDFPATKIYETAEDVKKDLSNIIRAGDVVLLKGGVHSNMRQIAKAFETLHHEYKAGIDGKKALQDTGLQNMSSKLWGMSATANDG